jgi:putative oxidoreductase
LSGLLALPAALSATVLLLFRVGAGAAWMQHGLMKARDGAWRQAGQWMRSMGVPPVLVPLVTALELLGGAFLILGLLVPVVGLLFFLEMAGIVVMKKTKMKATFLPPKPDQPSYEVDYLYMMIAVALIAVGAGAFSLDAVIGLF